MAEKTARTVLVTGASRGLGLGIARQLFGQRAQFVRGLYNPHEAKPYSGFAGLFAAISAP